MASEQSILAVIRAARPSFRNLHDRAAFSVHAAFSAAGYVLHATGNPAFDDEALSTSFTDEVGIDKWNEVEGNYAFVYSKADDKGSRKVIVKCLVLNDVLAVDVLKEGDESLLHLELDVKEYVMDNGGSNYGSQFKNLGKLADTINKEILDKLHSTAAAGSSGQSPSSGTSLRDSRARPGVEDHRSQDPYILPSGVIIPPVPGYGYSDLVPGPPPGMYPSSGDIGGGSMLIGPNDPRFFGGGTRQPGLPGGGSPVVPPGARFDPYGPPGVPGFEPNRFIRNARRPPGQTHPDLEHFRDGDFI